LCRREGTKLFLKGERCYTDKCSLEKRPYPPGHLSKKRVRKTDYSLLLREKQKLKRTYGLLEKQFRRYFEEAERQRGVTGESLLIMLERRLDNVVYRMGFAQGRRQARQLVRHGHILVNSRKVNLPSYLVKEGDIIRVKEKTQKIAFIKEALDSLSRRGVSLWLEIDEERLEGKIKALPRREQIAIPVQEQLVVEFYSK
jgi:small subunit ribosomal protein S4